MTALQTRVSLCLGSLFYVKIAISLVVVLSNALDFRVIDSLSVHPVSSCDSELLVVLFPSIKLILVAVYPPFWRDREKNERAISCIMDIIDYALSLPNFDVTSTKITVCGDFNDLVLNLSDLEEACGLRRIVLQNTRGNRILDQILTNIRCHPESTLKVLAPFGRSDHSVVF